MHIRETPYSPLLTSLLKERAPALVMGAAVGVQFGLVAAGLPGWPCPFKAAFGIPCPGCGLSTAVGQLLHGHLQAAMTTHAFAPVFLLGAILVLGISILPEPMRLRAIKLVSMIENRTGITVLILLGLLFYWGFRLFRL